MFKNIKIFAVLLTAFVATSCLDKVPGAAIPTEKAMQTFNDAEQHLNGIYAQLKSSALYSGYLTLLPDVQCDLVYAVDGYSNAMGSFWLWNFRSTSSEIQAVYATLYGIINECNFFLERVDGVIANEINDENIENLGYYKGECYAIRALMYSELIKCYCEAYDPATAQNTLGVVINKSFSNPGVAKRDNLYNSYQAVLEDLDNAAELLDEETDGYTNNFVSLAMVHALRARVALYMQDWDAAIEYSTKVIDNDAFYLSSASSVFQNGQSYFQWMWSNDVATEIIWRIGFTSTSYGGALGSYFLGFTTDYYYYYPDYVPAQWVLDLYQSADLRYDAYFATVQTGHTHQLTWPLLIKYYGNEEFMNYYNMYHNNMPKPFRLAEQYLIRAEAYCRKATPNYNLASKDLTTLRQARFANGGGAISLTKDNYLKTISDERVRELYMEGFRLQDLKRWGTMLEGGGFERKPQTSSLEEGSKLKISADNPRFVWPIPNHEIEAPGSQVEPNKSNN